MATTVSDMWAGADSTTSEEYAIGVDFGIDTRAWDSHPLEYDNFTYQGIGKKKQAIEVDKGSPAKSKYAIFYAVDKDPVIFCKNRRELYKEVKKLLKRKDVDTKSIRIFQLIGGAKKIAKRSAK